MDSKIRIKMGEVEVEYEGSQEFLKAELPALLDVVSKLYGTRRSPVDGADAVSHGARNGVQARDAGARSPGTTAAFAAKLAVKSGPDLMLAAAGKMAFADGLDVFSREQLLSEMKSATTFYRESFRKNLTQNLATLLKKEFNEVSSGKYALAQSAKASLEAKLGSS